MVQRVKLCMRPTHRRAEEWMNSNLGGKPTQVYYPNGNISPEFTAENKRTSDAKCKPNRKEADILPTLYSNYSVEARNS